MQCAETGTSIRDYYLNTCVQQRFSEFLGGPTPAQSTAVYLTSCDVSHYNYLDAREPAQLQSYLVAGSDIARSLWDRESIIAHLDIEYVNFDFPAEPYIDPQRCFEVQQPVELAIKKVLLEYGITPLHLLTGRGHHFIWMVRQNTQACRKISQLRHAPESLIEYYRTSGTPNGECVSEALGNAFCGLGLLIEYLAFRIKQQAAPGSMLPVEVTEMSVGSGERGREIVCLDISEYADPLNTRMIRIPFTVYRKPWEKGLVSNAEIAGKVASLFIIPLHEMDTHQALTVRCDSAQVAALARRSCVRIPDCLPGMERLIDEYQLSTMRKCHNFFYSQDHQPPQQWPATYDRMPLDMLPPCARSLIAYPNDGLLQPAGIKLVVCSLLSLGWHPRHIAGLIRSKYERDHGWGRLWYTYHAASRADFYARIITCSFMCGNDRLIDFNCVSTQGKKLCSVQQPSCNLEQFRDSLLERRRHARLACRPFNRLFLPSKHL